MKYMELAKVKSEGQSVSFDDIIRDIEDTLRRAECSRRIPKYVSRTLRAARDEILALRK